MSTMFGTFCTVQSVSVGSQSVLRLATTALLPSASLK